MFCNFCPYLIIVFKSCIINKFWIIHIAGVSKVPQIYILIIGNIRFNTVSFAIIPKVAFVQVIKSCAQQKIQLSKKPRTEDSKHIKKSFFVHRYPCKIEHSFKWCNPLPTIYSTVPEICLRIFKLIFQFVSWCQTLKNLECRPFNLSSLVKKRIISKRFKD